MQHMGGHTVVFWKQRGSSMNQRNKRKMEAFKVGGEEKGY